MKFKYKEKYWLNHYYNSLKFSANEIAEKCNVHFSTIWYWLKKLNIKTRDNSKCKFLLNGRKHPRWKKGKIDSRGYIYLNVKGLLDIKNINTNQNYTQKDKNIASKMQCRKGIILEHRLAIAIKLNRPLTKFEIVHHKNRKKYNNKLRNLELLTKPYHVLEIETDKLYKRINYLEKILNNKNIKF